MSQAGSASGGGGGLGADVKTLTGNTGGAVAPILGNINIVGTGSISVAGNPGTHTLTISSSGGGGGITTLDGDSGSATGSTVTIHGGSNMNTTATAATVTVNLDNTVSISGSMTAGTGFIATTGDVNIVAGNLDLPVTNAGLTQGVITMATLPFLASDTSGSSVFLGAGAGNPAAPNNIAIGGSALAAVSSGAANIAIGNSTMGIGVVTGESNNIIGNDALANATSATSNNSIGSFALTNLLTGSFNIAVGDNAGANYTGAESSNIQIGGGNENAGTIGENGVIRIGSVTGDSVQTSCFIAGIYGTTPSMSPQMTTIGSDGRLGSQAIPSGGVTTLDGDTGSATGSTITIAGGSNMNTSATGSTVTVNLDNTVSISGSMTAGTGFVATTGDVNIMAGNIDLPLPNTGFTQGAITLNGAVFLTSDSIGGASVFLGQGAGVSNVSQSSVAVGALALSSMAAGADRNNAIGTQSMAFAFTTTGTDNNALGYQSLSNITSGSFNQAIGSSALNSLNTGSSNIAIGQQAGANYSTESNNILLGNFGTVADSGVIRIGDTPQVSTFIAGIYGVTPAMSPQMATIGSDGQMGSQAIPSGGFTWTEITTSTVAMAVDNGYVLNNAGGVTATLPSTAAVGSVMEIVGKGTGGWTLAQNSGQTVHFGAQNTTTGTGGSIVPLALPADQYACLSLVCTTANTDFVVKSSVGNFTVT